MSGRFNPQKLVARYFPRSTIEEFYSAIFGEGPDVQYLDRLSAALRSSRPLRELIQEMQASATTEELYRGIFNRAPDAAGRAYWSKLLRNGKPLREVISRMLSSDEFQNSRQSRTIRQSDLPDITGELPRPYETVMGLDNLTHHVIPIEDDSEFDLLERLIVEHRFYDSFGGWGYSIDLDKHVTAAIVKGIGARSCL
ncbi:MAG TPA: DUF4214 domain-containing protein, partial [Rhizomicrobium sp.]|nr:DUF4214 domain-containing protein [Rhizomicrobium sp.]